MDIEKLADEFFEWDGPRTPVVSFVSAKLFAQHVAELALKEARKAIADERLLAPQDTEDDAYEAGLTDADSAVFKVLRRLTTPSQEPPMAEIKTQAYKVGNEFAPYHPQASHVDPSYRDGWNACFAAAEYLRTTSQPVEFSGVAARKLADLQTGGYQIDGYSIQHNVTGQRGFITSGGFVGWWTNMDHIKPAECPATSQPVGVPEGWKLVPIKCTEAMKDVGYPFEFSTISDGRLLAQSMWNELLTASPTPPAAQQPVQGDGAAMYCWLRRYAFLFFNDLFSENESFSTAEDSAKALDAKIREALGDSKTPKQAGVIAGDGKLCPNDHDPRCLWPQCLCRNQASSAPTAAGDEAQPSTHRVVSEELQTLHHITALAHEGGLADLSIEDALSAIRRLTLKYYPLAEKVRGSNVLEALAASVKAGKVGG